MSKSLDLIDLRGDIKGKVPKKKIKILLLRNHKADEAETWHTCIGHCPLQKLCFYSGRIRTLVAMGTYSFYRLIMGKVEIGNFYCLIGDNRILFLQKCLLSSSSHFIRLLSELLNLIGCRGNINSLIFEKNLFLKNHK